MVRTAFAFPLLLAVAACGKPAAPAPVEPAASKSPTSSKEFFELMERNDHHMERLMEMVEGKPDADAILRRLGAIRENMTKARALGVGKDEAMRKLLDEEFGRFDEDLQSLSKQNWSVDGRNHWRKLTALCSRCHDQFRED